MKPFVRTAAAAAVFALSAAGAHAANVLVVLSDAAQLELRDQRVYDTGFYANELMQPVKKLLDAGHSITFATPLGKAPTVDRNSLDAALFGGDAAMQEHLALLEKLKLTSPAASPVVSLARVEQGGYAQYDAVYIPGGHAPMQDLIRSPAVGRVLAYFHDAGKPTALVCHGPAALVAALAQPETFVARLESGARAAGTGWIYAGYRMTVISNAEEEAGKGYLKGGVMKLTPQTALEGAGGRYSSGPNWAPHVVADRELITGQNPASAVGVADLLLARLPAALSNTK
ncbi:thiamine biosynthesis protein ThiJ [Massilia sp. Root418]|uniref:type 1 glutamine amidotransferase domain-containing protein n=1 Tax=Massilia sp. Root418 TaxID=1736532 RepID=UPI0006F6BF7E|nr:type 1 glutamine amidotransferase domain-containing protein [Massilia sp. Root418]KQX01538.1 thiamine biosynthesis protein ThiJ [Massilia sp. Root418]